LERRYKELLAALKRMDDGTYGIDERTGKPIDIDRLEANPAATRNI
jgi:RNA polymerase-binding transcription factor DksA